MPLESKVRFGGEVEHTKINMSADLRIELGALRIVWTNLKWKIKTCIIAESMHMF